MRNYSVGGIPSSYGKGVLIKRVICILLNIGYYLGTLVRGWERVEDDRSNLPKQSLEHRSWNDSCFHFMS